MKKKVRYIILAGQCYYGGPGAYAMIGRHSTIEGAVQCAGEAIGRLGVTEKWEPSYPEDEGSDSCDPIEWSHILDIDTGEITHEFGGRPHKGESYIEVKDKE